jgi:hypothetical protein
VLQPGCDAHIETGRSAQGVTVPEQTVEKPELQPQPACPEHAPCVAKAEQVRGTPLQAPVVQVQLDSPSHVAWVAFALQGVIVPTQGPSNPESVHPGQSDELAQSDTGHAAQLV